MDDGTWPIRTVDRLGRLVVLPEGRWRHVLARHGELADARDLVLLAVRSPDLITRDASHADRRCCYLMLGGERRLKVVVEYGGESGGSVGTIVTAYLTDRTPGGEKQLWP